MCQVALFSAVGVAFTMTRWVGTLRLSDCHACLVGAHAFEREQLPTPQKSLCVYAAKVSYGAN